MSEMNTNNKSELKQKCSHCIHKKPFKICGCDVSPYYGTQVELTSRCECFMKNPAQDHFSKGLASYIIGDEEYPDGWKDAISDLELALRLGLPTDDVVKCIDVLASCHMALGTIELKGAKLISGEDVERAYDQNKNMSKALDYFEEAISLDARQEYKVFIEDEGY